MLDLTKPLIYRDFRKSPSAANGRPVRYVGEFKPFTANDVRLVVGAVQMDKHEYLVNFTQNGEMYPMITSDIRIENAPDIFPLEPFTFYKNVNGEKCVFIGDIAGEKSKCWMYYQTGDRFGNSKYVDFSDGTHSGDPYIVDFWKD